MPSPSPPPISLPEEFGKYRILRALGKGGMGTVFLAHDTLLDRDVALKICHLAADPHALERFRQEAKAAASLTHPNLCRVHDFDVRAGIAYLVMAFIDGPTLRDWVARNGRMSPREAAEMVSKLALAMQAAHDGGVIHRDLKPANIAIDEKGEPVILDFGLARQTDNPQSRLTQPGAVFGTLSYMAPEQARGDSLLIGPAADQYSLGVILYELLTGAVPFIGPPMVLLFNTVNTPPVPPRQHNRAVDAVLEEVCLRALAKKPEERFPRMADFGDALTDAARTASPDAPPRPTPDSGPEPSDSPPTQDGVVEPLPPPPPVPIEVTHPTLAEASATDPAPPAEVTHATLLEASATDPAPPAEGTYATLALPAPDTDPPTAAEETHATLGLPAAPTDAPTPVEESFATFALPATATDAPVAQAPLTANVPQAAPTGIPHHAPPTMLSRPYRRATAAAILGLILLPVAIISWQVANHPAADATKADEEVAGVGKKTEETIDPRLRLRPTAIVPKPVPRARAGRLPFTGAPRRPLPVLPFRLTPVFVNSAGIEMLRIPSGTFQMGSPEDEPHRDTRTDETRHTVRLTHGFYMSATLVTQAQWKAVMGQDDNPSQFKDDALPVDSIRWTDADRYCKRLGIREGRVYRLPTEAEWEYACRAGTATPFWFGDTITTDDANFNGEDPYRAGERVGAYRKKTTAATEFEANPWGLYDMHGNLQQWCADWYARYPAGEVTDPRGPKTGEERVLRGGSWRKLPWHCRAAARGSDKPDSVSSGYGFRVVVPEASGKP